MNDLIVVPQAAHWQRLKCLVLDSVSSPITRSISSAIAASLVGSTSRAASPATSGIEPARAATTGTLAECHGVRGSVLIGRHRRSAPIRSPCARGAG